ncbi:MAG: SDR family NAD(P)-dependent oxidoreductase, partial [Pseudomonadota bacterium]
MAGDRLKGKVAVISGGASGIGAASARRFVEEGARVVLGDIDEEKGQMLARELGDDAVFATLDVTKPAHWEAAFAAAESFGPVTTVVNSAGVSIPGSIEDIDLDGFRHTNAINLDGTFLGCKYGVAALKAGSGGSIVNVASTLGSKSGSIFPAYSASKGGVRLLTRSVALHCAEQGYDIRCNSILPGAIHTEMVERYVAMGEQAGQSRADVISGFADVHPMKRLGTPN